MVESLRARERNPCHFDLGHERRRAEIDTEPREAPRIHAKVIPTIQIQYFGAIREAAKKPEEEMELGPNTTVQQLLQRLVGVYGEGFRGEIFDKSGDSLRDDLMLTVNGTVLSHASAIDTHLEPGDRLALFPIFPGGG